MITTGDFLLSAIITHSVSAVVRATCLRTSGPRPDIIFKIYAICYALLEQHRGALPHGMWIILFRPLTWLHGVLQMLLHQHLVALGVAERLKWPKELNGGRREANRNFLVNVLFTNYQLRKKIKETSCRTEICDQCHSQGNIKTTNLSVLDKLSCHKNFFHGPHKHALDKCTTYHKRRPRTIGRGSLTTI